MFDLETLKDRAFLKALNEMKEELKNDTEQIEKLEKVAKRIQEQELKQNQPQEEVSCG
jgi:outer membrane protein assembly factor BamA